ncbi:hypothetical protein F2P81_018842 [Scophthalmus maximus]|uniref:Uncharacterized protein n=1 Tax=Scophthalmus maximus TaxID=52904 RepID=A0A6A4S996_SCOMX|nr:hypothetical protein F2P81_018842 [Scophthalmus maximus]
MSWGITSNVHVKHRQSFAANFVLIMISDIETFLKFPSTSGTLFGLASCSVLSEKELVGGQPEEEEEKVSMSHRILSRMKSSVQTDDKVPDYSTCSPVPVAEYISTVNHTAGLQTCFSIKTLLVELDTITLLWRNLLHTSKLSLDQFSERFRNLVFQAIGDYTSGNHVKRVQRNKSP